ALLAKKGYKVTAFDFNPHMVKAAKKKAKKAGVRIDFRQGDIKDFHFGRFDAAISLFSVLMFACKNQKELNQSIKCIKENLKPGGIGFFETCTPNLIKHSFELKKAEKGGTKLVRTRFYEKTHIKNLLETSYAFIIKRKGKPVQVIKARCTNRVFTKSETEQAIKRNGLRLLKTYGSLKNHGYENFSKKSIFISPLFIRSRTASL
ncbi:class I SAM-dependent methyltransferase, partial [Candidatus Woesearchaeota archaeon]|nr:class I SAM-dependent methyltransferase [Candidatus Woesearchaeota archaeon]